MALIKCIECGKDASDKATSCPHCGCPITSLKYHNQEFNSADYDFKKKDKQPKYNWNAVIGLLMMFAMAFILIYWILNMNWDNFKNRSQSSSNNSTYVDNNTAISATALPSNIPTPGIDKLELLSKETIVDGYSRYVSGEIRNNTNSKYSYVQITINFYDSNNNLIETSIDNVSNLDSGEVWKFKVYIIDDNADQYKITEISGRK